MQIKHLRFGQDFHVILGNKRSQAATMVIPPKESEGGPDTYHRGSDQWLYIVAGAGTSLIDGKSHLLRAGTLVLIEHGETHEIKHRAFTVEDSQFLHSPWIYEVRERPFTRQTWRMKKHWRVKMTAGV